MARSTSLAITTSPSSAPFRRLPLCCHLEQERWFEGEGYEAMHVQGRRWSGDIGGRFNPKKGMAFEGSIFNAGPIFESYGVAHDDVPINSPNGRISCKLIAVDAGLPKTKLVEEQLKLFKPPNGCKNVSILRAVFGQICETKKLNKKVRMIVSMKHAAVMLEQASYCYLLSIPPMLRKYGFHLVLSGN
ncbi:uncharacterized protein LOC121986970 [Zingiber officinale]|uniref:uncharacterized protein LOC121986970 n=1 Tax=Zingiber officinale TaxID=94328 RepID=UPI001C4C4A1C|nr:uncharacterized protein LOC121986970 [Zingiber officinale]